MEWDHRHRRAAGFAVAVLRPVGVYAILAMLTRMPHLHPAEILRILRAADEADTPLVGARGFDLPAVSRRVSSLREAQLIVRCAGQNGHGSHGSYDLTRLGAGMIGSLAHLTGWGMRHYDLALAASRLRTGMTAGASAQEVPDLRARRATGMALGVFDMRWSFSMLSEVRTAGDRGVESMTAQTQINGEIRAMPEQVRHLMHGNTRHAVLRYLESSGLVMRRREPRFARPARVFYATTEAGTALMDSLWPLATWGAAHDRELTTAMSVMTTWFAPAAGS